MRKAMLLLAVFGLAGSLWAADPIVGTWKLNIAKSKAAPGQTSAKEMTVVTKEAGTDLETSFEGVGADGKPFSIKFTNPQQGGILSSGQTPPQASADGNFTVITVIQPGERYGTSIQKGKQVEVTHAVVSKDGKTMTRTSKSVDAQGKPIESLLVFEKQ